jgi:glycine/D-amino acid oxidase-like deaminating enzyme
MRGNVVIVGGGVAGCATACYLAKVGVAATIVEREWVATQASGYAAGELTPLQGFRRLQRESVPNRCPTQAKQAALGATTLTTHSQVLAALARPDIGEVAPGSRC